MLAEVLGKESILLKRRVKDWREAVELAGQPLLESGAIRREYIDAMVASVKENGPYMVIAEGMALAHARPGEGVNRVGMSLLTLETPVPFGVPEFDPVDLVIAFSTTSNSAHLEALRELGEILMDAESVAAIRAATRPEQVLDLFQKAKNEPVE